MPIRNSVTIVAVAATLSGCATAPQYVVRQAPRPDESQAVIEFERAISRQQAQEFEQQGARRIESGERLWGVDVSSVIQRLSRVTERPDLRYEGWLYHDQDPNAAALADGRIYLSSGMLDYLSRRGSRQDELAFTLAHELAHTVAQHLVKRYRTLQQQQLLVSLVAAGASVATRGASSGAQQAGQLAVDAASLLRDLAISGYSQDQELEADQLGIRYCIKAGYNPQAALELLTDFAQFDRPTPFFRTHPYVAVRREHLQRYLAETSTPTQPSGDRAGSEPSGTSMRQARAGVLDRDGLEERRRQLRKIQELYPRGSVSWNNLQRQIDALR